MKKYYIERVDFFDDEDDEFEGDYITRLFINDEILYEEEANRTADTFIDGYLTAFEHLGIPFEFTKKRINECYDCDSGLPGEYL